MIDLSIFLPAIRTTYWDKFYDSIVLSCKKYKWELVLCGPFPLTSYLQTKDNVKMVQDFGSPSRCAQLASFQCEGELLYHCVDDAMFFPDAIDKAIDLYKTLNNKKAIINMKYREGQNFSGDTMRESYWIAYGHDGLRLPGIPSYYRISLHHLLDASYFRELGGYECSYEYQNFNLHSFIFRAQHDGAIVYNSPIDVTTCDHQQKDHRVIEEAHNQNDYPLFLKTYSNSNVLKEMPKIDINNWTQQPSIWTRRFKTIPKQYEDLLEK